MAPDWKQGTWQAKDAGVSDASVVIASDWMPRGNHEALVLSSPEAVYGDLLPELRAGDLRVVNLECALTGGGEPIWKGGPNLRVAPKAVGALKAVPFEVACLANNHTCDYGAEGLADTLAALKAEGIEFVGAGLSEEAAFAPLIVEAGGARIGMVDFCEGEDHTTAREGAGVFGWDLVRAMETVKELRERVDVVLISGHCGREYAPVPPPYVVEVFRRLADAGADAVIGHHPHVPQGVEVYGGVPIFYSLGNFVFAQQGDAFYKHAGYMVRLELSGKRIAGFRLIPYVIRPEGLEKMDARTAGWFLGRLKKASEPLRDAAAVRAVWEAFIDRFGAEAWRNGCVGLSRTAADLSGEKAAATVRNIFLTPAHRELRMDAMTRLIDGKMDTSPKWARELVEEWETLTLEEALQVAGKGDA